MVLWIEFSQIVNDFKIETGRRMGIELVGSGKGGAARGCSVCPTKESKRSGIKPSPRRREDRRSTSELYVSVVLSSKDHRGPGRTMRLKDISCWNNTTVRIDKKERNMEQDKRKRRMMAWYPELTSLISSNPIDLSSLALDIRVTGRGSL